MNQNQILIFKSSEVSILIINNIEYLILKNVYNKFKWLDRRVFSPSIRSPSAVWEWEGEEEHRGTEKLCEYKTVEQSLPMNDGMRGKSKFGIKMRVAS